MNRVDQIIFNLLFNSVCSFFAGLLVVYLSLKIFRVNTSRWKLYFLTLPFVKILWDIGRGIPASSYMFHDINPLSLPPKHGYFSIGMGFSQYGPILNACLSVKDMAGKEYSTSVGDYLWLNIVKRWSASAPKMILTAVFATSLTLLVVRLANYWRFERKRKRDRQSSSCMALGAIKIRYRQVDVYVSEQYNGTPFTGGVFRPFICIPKSTYALLSQEEREAVIKHELAHVRFFDLPITLGIKLLGDFFWFVPGYKFVSRKIDRLREILADQSVVKIGVSSIHLASALVKLRDCEISLHNGVLYSAFLRETSLLKVRVNRLIGDEAAIERPRFGWNNKFVRLLIIAWTTGGVMISTFGGNHEIGTLPAWVERLLRAWGLM